MYRFVYLQIKLGSYIAFICFADNKTIFQAFVNKCVIVEREPQGYLHVQMSIGHLKLDLRKLSEISHIYSKVS